MTDQSFNIVKIDDISQWEKRSHGWFAIPVSGADFSIKIGENLEVNGYKLLRQNLVDYVSEAWQDEKNHTQPMQYLKTLVDRVEPVTFHCIYSSQNNSILVVSVDGWGLMAFPNLVNDLYIKGGMGSYYNMSFLSEEQLPQAEIWKSEGRCPKCGTSGYFHRTALMCPNHGIFGGF